MSEIVVLQAEELSHLVSCAVRKGVSLATQDMKAKPYMTEKEAAEYLGLSASTLRQMRTLSKGPRFSKMGGNVRYKVTDLDAYSEKHRVLTYDS